MRDKSWQLPFFTMWGGQAFSLLGSQLVQFALVWWLTVTTGSAAVLATATTVALLPHDLSWALCRDARGSLVTQMGAHPLRWLHGLRRRAAGAPLLAGLGPALARLPRDLSPLAGRCLPQPDDDGHHAADGAQGRSCRGCRA